MNTKPLGPFIGINNRLPDFKMNSRRKDLGGDYVRSAVDVLLTDSGTFKCRKSADKIQSMTGAHSMFGSYLVRAAVLYQITMLPTYSETLVKLLTSNARGDWEKVGSDLYFSNGVDRLRIDATGTVYPWGMETPDAPDGLSTITGTLNPGWYQVAVAYANETTGEEGGVSSSCNYMIDETGGFRVPLPGASDGATHVVLYVSGCNGEVPTAYGSYAIGTASVDVTIPATGREAMQRYEAPLPAGDQLFYYNGRLCSISGNTIYYGLPFRPGYYVPTDGYIPFPNDVTVVVPAQNGIYVATDKTYWIPGDIESVEGVIQDVLPYGAVKGTGFAVPNKTQYGWFGAQGIVIATSQGEVAAVMSDNIKLTAPSSGVSVVIEDDDSRRVVSCGWCLNLDTKAATTYSGYEFTSISGRYATKADGIYDLQGTADVVGSVGFGKVNFDEEHKKLMPAVYLGAASPESISLTVAYVNDAGASVSYSYQSRTSGLLSMHRVDPGKGIRANWFDLSLSGKNLTLASVSFAPIASSRRV